MITPVTTTSSPLSSIITEAQKVYQSSTVQAFNLGNDGARCAVGVLGTEIDLPTLAFTSAYCIGAVRSAQGLGNALGH
jgi:hypothetical protein